MTNPLKSKAQDSDWSGPLVPRTKDDWLAWCWERNERARAAGWRHWLLVRDTPNGGFQTESVSGDDAAEVWMMLDDKPLIPFQWPEHAIRKNLGIVQWRLHRGMTPDAYMIWSVEGRAARRKAWIESEIRQSSNRQQDPAANV
jgi:hypothetical protein